MTLSNLRSHIALVSQDITLFDDTVAANIAYGAMAGAQRAAIEQAATAAHALEFIRALPQVFKGEHLENDEVTERRGARVEISADRDFPVYADGEHLTDLPATIRTLTHALRVIAPPAPA